MSAIRLAPALVSQTWRMSPSPILVLTASTLATWALDSSGSELTYTVLPWPYTGAATRPLPGAPFARRISMVTGTCRQSTALALSPEGEQAHDASAQTAKKREQRPLTIYHCSRFTVHA